MKKKIFCSILAGIVLSSSTFVSASASSNITVKMDGNPVTFADQQPELKNNTTYVPVRGTFEHMGAKVECDQSTKAVKISINNISINFSAGADIATVTKNGQAHKIKVEGKTYIENNRTMVPLRFVATTLGYDVEWQENKNNVVITSNSAKAIELINSFATGDTTVAQKLLTEGYIQHNLAYGTGRDAFVAAVKGLAAAPTKTTVKTVRAFSDGDYVVLQSIYNFAGAGDQIAFDVFRFENGKIAEHWDNLTALAPANPSGHTQTDGAATIKDTEKTLQNKVLVNQFIQDVLMGKNIGALPSYFDGNNYTQHNSSIADGLDGLGNALEAWAKQGITMQYTKTPLLLGQGNYVFAASEGTLGGKSTAFFDLWRVENGKIAEHWDVISSIPEQSTWANHNGKF